MLMQTKYAYPDRSYFNGKRDEWWIKNGGQYISYLMIANLAFTNMCKIQTFRFVHSFESLIKCLCQRRLLLFSVFPIEEETCLSRKSTQRVIKTDVQEY